MQILIAQLINEYSIWKTNIGFLPYFFLFSKYKEVRVQYF